MCIRDRLRLMIGGLFTFLIPLIVLLVAVFRQKGEWNESAEKKG